MAEKVSKNKVKFKWVWIAVAIVFDPRRPVRAAVVP